MKLLKNIYTKNVPKYSKLVEDAEKEKKKTKKKKRTINAAEY